jgi:hypothetical protein
MVKSYGRGLIYVVAKDAVKAFAGNEPDGLRASMRSPRSVSGLKADFRDP